MDSSFSVTVSVLSSLSRLGLILKGHRGVDNAGFVSSLAAVPIGGIAAIISYYGMLLLKMKLGMDDLLDVFACRRKTLLSI